MKKVKASLVASLYVDCPYCNEQIDLFGYENDEDCGRFTIPIFNNKFDDIEGSEAICTCCDKLFIVSEVLA